MNFLMDTHATLWWFDDPNILSGEARKIISNKNNSVYVSAVSVWEIVIKRSLGKLEIPDEIFNLIDSEFLEMAVLSIHARKVADLPDYHNDPFDRLLIAQVENSIILTRDKMFKRYEIPTILV
jgi:PIN domain nuclease of toxin-antitoxin system